MVINFSPPDITENEINEVAAALRSGWITTGPRTKKLEKIVAEYVDSDCCVCLNSQTACAELALRLLGVGEGDEVITCAYTYTATASVIDHIGAKIVLVDSQKDDIHLDYDALEKAITEKTKVIIPVDLAGLPCDYDRIFDIVEKKKDLFKPANELQEAIGRIAVVADAAHALGAEYKNKKIGSIADFTSFSFHAVKNLTTAEGGALTWKAIEGISNDDIYKKLQLMSLHGQSKDAYSKCHGSWDYDIVGTWYKCNMTDVVAAMGISQFQRYPQMLDRRHYIINKYNEALKPLGVVTLEHVTDVYRSSGHLYITRIPGIDENQRNEIIIKMGNTGIACNVHYKPLPMHTAYKNLGFDIKNYPNAYDYYKNEITLPLHTSLTEEEVDYVIERYTTILKDYLK
ncbi:MAG: DegT/DnrJ/EryC1/StrS family aminotransferase [Clostridia bacterium]|nr:DegT/DnrJ/EryC1/StrS family aminotransferase [Clostridia bacterium]